MTISNQGDLCRRKACYDTPLHLGLCGPHWVRWQDGADELNLPDDDMPAPPRTVFTAPIRQGSLSQRLPPGRPPTTG